MLLNAIAIVAREVIESALVACLLIALVRLYALPRRYILWGFALGIAAATIYGGAIGIITPWWDYRGQEVIMVSVNFLMVALILTLLAIKVDRSARHLPPLIILLIGLSLTLEISEIGIYINAYRNKPDLLASAITGSVIGACIGVSLAVIGFYTLLRLNAAAAVRIIRALFALLVGGLLSQNVQMLIQVDLLPAQAPAWDSSAILSENSIIGQFLVAVLRYEARPTWLQVFAYVGGTALALWLVLRAKTQSHPTGHQT